METGFIIATVALIAVVIFFAVVTLVGNKKTTKTRKYNGVLNVYHDNQSDDPRLLLTDLDSIEDIVSRKQVIFNVNVIKQNSQE